MSAAGCINQRSLRGVPEWSLAYRALLPDRPVVTADNLKCNVKIKIVINGYTKISLNKMPTCPRFC